jgi:hypothetical protein
MKETAFVPKTIYTFWEPKEQLIHYLELCRSTWDKNLPEYEIVDLNYQNLNNYLEEDIYDFSVLKSLPWMMQKDAIMVAVLKHHGGVFMDIDTLVMRDIAPVYNMLSKYEVIMFDSHIAFIASRAESRVLSLWLIGIKRKLAWIKETNKKQQLNSTFVGNNVLAEVLDEICQASKIDELIRELKPDAIKKMLPSHFHSKISKLFGFFMRGRRFLYFKTYYKKFLNKLNRDKYGFIQEIVHFRTNELTAMDKYIKFWFDDILDVDNGISKDPMVIGLHNSWTPDWYKNLSIEEVFNCDCLLSKTLKFILGENIVN